MKTLRVFARFVSLTRRALIAGVIALILARLPAFATTFTNDTTINVNDTNYDGTDIVVTNCTLTVNGPHAFSSLFVAGGGALTHSFSPNGFISNIFFVANESQVLNGTNPVTLLNSNILTDTVLVTDSGSTIIYTNGVDYLLTSPDGILTQLQRTTNSTIPDGTNVLVNYDVLLGTLPAGLNLSVTGNVEVAMGGVINANGKGYGGGAGPGAGHIAGNPQDGSGAGYGGIGGMSSSNAMGGTTYGSFLQPANLGSGGGASYAGIGGAGGGAIQITAGGTFIINGTISANGANGTNSRSGGGSGGSIWITAHLVSGSGTISAQGGAGEPTHGGGGGGGRIAIQSDVNSFTGSLAAQGGAGAKIGGAGTVYTKLTGQNGLLVFDNAGQAGTNSLVAISSSSIDVLIRGKAGVIPAGAWLVGNLTIASNGLLLVSSAVSPINLTASGNVTIQAGGSLLTDSAGYAAGTGPGYGLSYNDGSYRPCGGGGYGGSGANGASTNAGGGTTYGSQTSPTMYGSGGGQLMPYSFGGAGGGAIQLNVSGILQVDGRLSANGGSGSGSGGGGGSGGSIWLTTGILIGSGSITANGGNGAGSIGGGGGGGRIAIYPAANLFGGAISAYGGGGANWGGAGTVFLQPTGQNGQLILDNGGHVGTNTLVQSASSADLILRNGAIGSASSSVNFANLLMSSNAWLTAYLYSSKGPAYTVNFSFSGNATIQAGSSILADAAGYPGGQGPGVGQYGYYNSTYVCSGAGHGGYGANSTGNYALGGNTYDSTTYPTSPGSGGGSYYSPSSVGGSGGGMIWLTVTGTLQMDGTISANGGNGSGLGGGGGSGGSIWLTVGTLSGAGTITVNGGSGAASLGGGGGGGIIYIPCTNNFFAGNASAYGGGGANWGGAGTVLIKPYGQNGQLILDNGGHYGTNTPLSSASSTDLTLRNGAIGVASSSVNFANLLLSSNGWLAAFSQSPASFSISSNATIQAGGGIIADASGYAAGQGTGAGHYYYYNSTYLCSGAGHGGYGANSTGNYALGGNTYDSTTHPTISGSGGGSYSPYSYSVGGAGGGAIRLNVSGILQVDGRISANGGNGSGSGGGGGSGGSIWLTVSTLSGTGSVTANGGSGADAIGGGGGGGCIAITYNNNSFAGPVSAYGGGGAGWGGAGTVYLKANSQSYAQLILDNGGNAGTNTTFSASSIDLLVAGRAVGQWPSGASVRNLQIRTNSMLTTVASSSFQIVNVTGDATIDAGGAISVDGTGSGASSGTGAGYTYATIKGGGGHGGFGAANPSGFGGAYGSIQSPVTAGSGGGNGSGSSYAPYGGAGGGALRFSVLGGTLTVNGRVSANGKNGDVNSGGGSGGSIWIAAGTLAGSGTISANGGSGNGLGGGGAGGRISLGYTTSAFTGPVSACGGGGYTRGGAGTIYTKVNGPSVGQLLVDNGGPAGTNTPLSTVYGTPSSPFNLTVGGGAVVCPQSSFPVLSNLNITAGGLFTSLSGQSNLDLMILGNVDVAAGGAIAVDAKGFAQTSGPGAGQSVAGSGSGAGYGGLGGASATAAPGGTNYGSAQQPVDQGSGGGFGSGTLYGGSEGGGAIRLNVGGVLTVDGQLSANGNWGLQDNSGGGSGGSVWVTAGTLVGNGQITADGGEGELYGGGGGAGGRIAVYSHANVFAGLVSVFGGEGDFRGADGSIFYSANLTLQVLSHTPVGIVSNGVSSVDLVFNEAPDPASFSGTDVSLTTPNGPLSPDALAVSTLSSSSYRVSFPLQTAVGDYIFTVGTNINDLYGQTMSQVYTGAFTISLPVIQGAITGTNGQPVSGVLVQPDGGLSTTTTDTNGNYALGILPGWSGTVVPSGGGFVFAPGSRVYTNVTTSISNQNYVAVITIAPVVSAGLQATNLMMNWFGISGVTYQLYSSTNLVDWLPYGDAFPGTNGPVVLPIPINGDPARFFRVQASN